MDVQQDLDSPMAIAAVMGLIVVGTLAINLLPSLVGSFVDHLGFSEQNAGLVAAAQLFGSAFGLLISTAFLGRTSLRKAAVIALVLIAFCDVLSAGAQGALALSLVRFCAGAGAGVILGVAIGIMSAARNPDARFGLALVAQFSVGAGALYTLPTLLASFGMAGTFLSIACVSAAGLLLAPWIARRTAARDAVEGDARPLTTLFTRPVILVLLSFCVFYISNGAQWAYADRIGADGGLPVELVSTALSISMIFGILGAVAAAAVAGHLGREPSLLLGASGAVAASIILTFDFDFFFYCAAVCLINFSLSFVVPFYLGVLASADATGRLGSVAYVLNLLAMSLGPAAGGLIVDGGYDPFLFATASGYGLSFVLVLYGIRHLLSSIRSAANPAAHG